MLRIPTIVFWYSSINELVPMVFGCLSHRFPLVLDLSLKDLHPGYGYKNQEKNYETQQGNNFPFLIQWGDFIQQFTVSPVEEKQ